MAAARLTCLALIVLLYSASVADAQLIEITPEVFSKVSSFAVAAKQKHPTSPTEAVYAFQADFNGEFGDIRPMSSVIVESPALVIRVITPINALYLAFATALSNLEPLPEKPGISLVAIEVRPTQMNAPNVRRVVLFLDGKEIPPELDGLKPTEFRNRLGATETKGAGLVVWKPEVFTTPGIVKVVAINDGPAIEWEYSASRPGPLKE